MSRPPESPASRAVAARSGRSRLLVVVAVCGGIAVGLRLVDQIPPWWLGQPRAPVTYASVQALERQQRTRLLLPFFFPDSIVWPPARVVLSPGQGRPVLVEFRRADGTGVGLALTQTLDGDFAPPARLVPDVEVSPIPAVGVDAAESQASRGTTKDGRAFLEISEVVDGRRVVLRWFDPDPGPLRRMARSLRRS
jgi:hypothetical protein